MNLTIPTKHIWIIVISSLAINFLFFSATYKKYFFSGLVTEHGEIGFNVYHNNSIQVSTKRLAMISCRQSKELRLVDPIDVDLHDNQAMRFRSVNDTIGYGVLLGLLWKITKSLRYQDVQILQIFLFTLALLLLYKISLLLFSNSSVALFSCIAQLFFFPLIFLNVHPLRDIWSYYGILVLLYGLLRARYEQKYDLLTFICAIGFAVCQWMRPTIVFTLLAVLLPLIIWRKHALHAWFIFLVVNSFLFWMPFIYYNKVAYNRYFVSTAGQDLYEGLGEYSNSWGIKMSDSWCGGLIYERYGLSYGTPEFQDKAFQLFRRAIYQKPWEYLGQLCRRLPTLALFAANWSFDVDDFAQVKKIPLIGSLIYFLLKVIRYTLAKFQYVRLYLLCGWVSVLLLWIRRRYFEIFLFLAIAWSCACKFPSQLEPRYLVPYFAIFSLLIGYGVYELFSYWSLYILKSKKLAVVTR